MHTSAHSAVLKALNASVKVTEPFAASGPTKYEAKVMSNAGGTEPIATATNADREAAVDEAIRNAAKARNVAFSDAAAIPALETVPREVATIKDQVAALTGSVSGIASQVQSIAEQVASLASNEGAGMDQKSAAKVDGLLAKLESISFALSSPKGLEARIGAIEAKIASLEELALSLPSKETVDALAKRVTALEAAAKKKTNKLDGE